MIHVAPGIELDENELLFEFVRSSGPGGQNVNKVSTAVQMRFDVGHSPAIPDDVRARLLKLAGPRITDDGILVIDARSTRSQTRNRELAVEQLVDLIRKAAVAPKKRYKTRPTTASKIERREGKAQRSKTKQLRGPVRRYDE